MRSWWRLPSLCSITGAGGCGLARPSVLLNHPLDICSSEAAKQTPKRELGRGLREATVQHICLEGSVVTKCCICGEKPCMTSLSVLTSASPFHLLVSVLFHRQLHPRKPKGARATHGRREGLRWMGGGYITRQVTSARCGRHRFLKLEWLGKKKKCCRGFIGGFICGFYM